MTNALAARPTGPHRRPHPRIVLLAASLGVLIAQVDTSVVNLAVKSIGRDLGAGVGTMQWVVDAYNLVYASLLLTSGALGDRYGRRRVFVAGVGLFVLGTLACALAPDATTLIGGRLLSGLGAAFELPMSLVLLAVAYPDARARAHALGIWASCNGLAFVIGPTVGGWLVDTLGWRSIFYMTLPLGAAAVALTLAAIEESRAAAGRTLDLAGQGLAILALGGFAFAAIEAPQRGFTASIVLAAAAIAFVAGVLFLCVEARTKGPLVPLAFLRQPVFAAALAAAFLMTFGMYALLFVMPLYFQVMRGASPFEAGLDLLPLSASFIVVSQLVGHLTNRLGPRIVMAAGMACMGLGALAIAVTSAGTRLVAVELALIVVGIGLGLNTAPVNGVAVAALPAARSGTASGLVNTARMTGATLGVAILGAAFAALAGQAPAPGAQFLAGLRAALGGGAAAELLGAAIVVAFIRRDSMAVKR